MLDVNYISMKLGKNLQVFSIQILKFEKQGILNHWTSLASSRSGLSENPSVDNESSEPVEEFSYPWDQSTPHLFYFFFLCYYKSPFYTCDTLQHQAVVWQMLGKTDENDVKNGRCRMYESISSDLLFPVHLLGLSTISYTLIVTFPLSRWAVDDIIFNSRPTFLAPIKHLHLNVPQLPYIQYVQKWVHFCPFKPSLLSVCCTFYGFW